MGETTTFSALVVPPNSPTRPRQLIAWSWCPLLGRANEGYRLPVHEAQVRSRQPPVV